MQTNGKCSKPIPLGWYSFFILLTIFLVAGLFVFLVLARKVATDDLYSTQTRVIMGTEVTIKAEALPEDIKQAFEVIRKIDHTMNHYNSESEISLLNAAGKKEVSPELSHVIDRAIHFARITEGAFDITVQPLVMFWRRMEQEKKIPTPEELENILTMVGFEKIKIEERMVLFEREGMGLDLGGIAKGYAVDKAIDILRDRGIRNALINAGGDLYCLGKGPRGAWKVGIQHPRKMDELIEIIEVADRGVATSGDYRRFYMISGKRFSHIINPATGWTVQDNPMSVTIIAPDATTADALATGIFVLGPERGMQLIESLPDIEGMIICEDMHIFRSSNWGEFAVRSSN